MTERQKHLIQYLKNNAREFKKLSRKINNKPKRGRVHDLRVCIRRMRSCLWLVKHGGPHDIKVKKLNKILRDFSRKLGVLRELQVAIKDARTYGVDAKVIKQKREEMVRTIKFSRKSRKKVAIKASQVIRALEKRQQMDFAGAIAELREKLSALNGAQVRDTRHLHELRITFKKTRYALEALGQAVEPIREVQGVLGRVHDLEILSDLIGYNKTVSADRKAFGQKALRMAGPAIRFAAHQSQLLH